MKRYFFRPGPARIKPGQVPEGVVFHIYTTKGRLLMIQKVGPGLTENQVEQTALEDGAFTGTVIPQDEDPVIVAYDGDTGERIDLNAVLGTKPGQPIPPELP